jgi:copper chaperone CopZ
MNPLALLLAAGLAGACSPADGSPAGDAQALVTATFALREAPSCTSCTGTIDRALGALPGVAEVQVAVGETRLLVRHDPHRVTAAALLAELERAGLPADPAP